MVWDVKILNVYKTKYFAHLKEENNVHMNASIAAIVPDFGL